MSGGATKEILITGASSGIGFELARQLAGPGTRLWLTARSSGQLTALEDEIRAKGGAVETKVVDLSQIEANAGLVEELFREVAFDEVYLGAAVSIFGEVKDIQPEDWDVIYRTDLLSQVQWMHAAYTAMAARKRGKIVLVSSLAGYAGYPTSVPYSTMKAGLLGLFRTLRHEARDQGISVHLVSPGYVRTKIYQSAIYRRSNFESTLQQIEEMGFGMIEPDRAAELLLKGVAAGKAEIVFPAYAKLLAWTALRFPWVVGIIHARMVKRFRELSA